MLSIGPAYERLLDYVMDQMLELIADIPDDALNTWLPEEAVSGGQEMNTFASQCVHVISAAEYMTLHGIGGESSNRNRDAEFTAQATQAEIREKFAAFRIALHALIQRLDDADLLGQSHAIRFQERGWGKAEGLFHALDHTALHLGNMQIQKQLWLASQKG